MIKWEECSKAYAIADKKLQKEYEGDDLTAMTNPEDKNQFYSSSWMSFFIYKPKKGEYNYEI